MGGSSLVNRPGDQPNKPKQPQPGRWHIWLTDNTEVGRQTNSRSYQNLTAWHSITSGCSHVNFYKRRDPREVPFHIETQRAKQHWWCPTVSLWPTRSASTWARLPGNSMPSQQPTVWGWGLLLGGTGPTILGLHRVHSHPEVNGSIDTTHWIRPDLWFWGVWGGGQIRGRAAAQVPCRSNKAKPRQ